MVVSTMKNTAGKAVKQGESASVSQAAIIKASTPFDTCNERLTAFGGFLSLVKFADAIGMQEVFESQWKSPRRRSELGCWRMVMGCISLLFIGFQRLGQFDYIRTDAMLCGYFTVPKLPAVSTYWRYLRSLNINHARFLLRIGAILRDRVWQMLGIAHETIHVNIDTTVATVYGKIEGARKGHNTKHRGKSGLRPALLFIDETREYLCGIQRRGETMSGKEVAYQILESKQYLPKGVRKVILRGDGEFISWDSVDASEENGYEHIFGNKRCTPPYPKNKWYRHGTYEYNEVVYQPIGWERPSRFVVMRIPKELLGDRQLNIFEDDNYVYRDFSTNRKGKPHKVIEEYDGRADIENCIGEAQRAGLLAIPSKSFASNRVFFQMVMFAYNLWRWMNLAIRNQQKKSYSESHSPIPQIDHDKITACTINVLRLKMLFVAAKIVTHSDQTKVRYSIHDTRAENIIDFMQYLDRKRADQIKWDNTVAARYYRNTG
jgi:hypothetical protein